MGSKKWVRPVEMIAGGVLVVAVSVGGISLGVSAYTAAQQQNAHERAVSSSLVQAAADDASVQQQASLTSAIHETQLQQAADLAAAKAAAEKKAAEEAAAKKAAAVKAAQLATEQQAAQQTVTQSSVTQQTTTQSVQSVPADNPPADAGLPAGAPVPWIADSNPQDSAGGRWNTDACASHNASTGADGKAYCD